jgi:hypothetical protein
MAALVLKLTLAPGLVAVATLVARRLGDRAAGMVAGLPVVAGPIVLILAVEHGDGYAKVAAAAAVLGMVSLVAYCVAYALVARRAGVVAALTAGTLAFGLGTLCLSGVDPPLALSAAVTLAVVAAGAWFLGSLRSDTPSPRARGDLLPWRVVITAVLVLAFTGVAGGLSAHLAGLLVPVPIITAVLAAFSQARAGSAAAVDLLGGLVFALFSFLVFFVALAALLVTVSAAAAFTLASAAALACWALLAWGAPSGTPALRPRP